MNNFWKGILSEDGQFSSKRLVTVVTAGIFLISCITVITLLVVMFISVSTTQKINVKSLETLTELLRDVMYYEFMLVVSGLGYITAPQFASALSSSLSSLMRSRAKSQGYGFGGGYFNDDSPLDIPIGKIEKNENGELIG